MIKIYGSLNKENIHKDTSKTLQGAKNYATRHYIGNVSERIGYSAFLVATKVGKKWVNINY